MDIKQILELINPTYEQCLKLVKKEGMILKSIPKNVIDYNLCFEAVKNDGSVLEYVPKELRDYEICKEAVKKKDIFTLYFVPKEIRKLLKTK